MDDKINLAVCFAANQPQSSLCADYTVRDKQKLRGTRKKDFEFLHTIFLVTHHAANGATGYSVSQSIS